MFVDFLLSERHSHTCPGTGDPLSQTTAFSHEAPGLELGSAPAMPLDDKGRETLESALREVDGMVLPWQFAGRLSSGGSRRPSEEKSPPIATKDVKFRSQQDRFHLRVARGAQAAQVQLRVWRLVDIISPMLPLYLALQEGRISFRWLYWNCQLAPSIMEVIQSLTDPLNVVNKDWVAS
ncbi:hypothetical protein cyc_01154 [Cyclospora cayetanensis]|uniref:Uncharacterized protein n=1 Tax=Cyclospora cayetanensis TaxID=88456 RepID=A0A1D3DA38_9EIME|nr:hypothetical protein cyc_01154 [Cyclospora cayetanensis]